MTLKMPSDKTLVIADSSCLIVLDKIGALQLLKELYLEIIITPEIKLEYGKELPDWIVVKQANKNKTSQFLKQLDLGEASALSLAIDLPEKSLIILDDLKARQVALKQGLAITGTIGLIVKAHLLSVIPDAIELLQKIEKTDFRVSNKILKSAYTVIQSKT